MTHSARNTTVFASLALLLAGLVTAIVTFSCRGQGAGPAADPGVVVNVHTLAEGGAGRAGE